MKKKDAIRLLSERLNELYSQNFDPVVWSELTTQLIKKVFPVSFQDKIDSIEEIEYVILAPMADQDMQDRKKAKGISQAKTYIDAYIKEIDQHGIENEGNNNQQSFWGNLKTFWGIVTIIVSAAFGLGIKIGNTKFDQYKNDLYNQVIALSSDTTKNNETIRKQNIIINQKDSILNVKSDSIKELEDNIQNAYLYIGNNIDKK